MKICIVCGRLCYGGAERVAVLWANAFRQSGHQVMVITNLYEPITYKVENGVIVRNLVSTNNNKIVKWLSSILNIRKIVGEFQPEVLVGVMATCSFVAKISTCGGDIPVIATEHNSFERPKSAPMSIFSKFFKFKVNRIYDAVTVLTKADEAFIGNSLSNVHVMPNPLALTPLNVLATKKKYVLAAGRLDEWYTKGFDVLIKAWGTMLRNEEAKAQSGDSEIEELKEWKLKIAGRGNENSITYLKKLCKDYGVEDSVEFLGFVSDMKSLYEKASVFVLSSRYEGFGMVLIEAMSQGCACIACDYKGRQSEIIQNENQGLCCEPDNVDALVNALQRMIFDGNYRESVRFNAIERSKFYSINNVVDRWESLFNNIKPNRVS